MEKGRGIQRPTVRRKNKNNDTRALQNAN